MAARPRGPTAREATVSWRQRRQERFERWLSPPGVEFASLRAKELYQARVARVQRAVSLDGEPDRVPIFPNYTFLPAYIMGATPMEVMTDQDQAFRAWALFGQEMGFDCFNYYGIRIPIPLMRALGYGLYQWPGLPGLPPDHVYRYVSKDWLKAPDEYRAVAEDPSDYWLRSYLPSTCEALSGLSGLGRILGFNEAPSLAASLAPFGRPEVRASMERLMEAGAIALKWVERSDAFVSERAAQGEPAFAGGFAKAPFDMMTDTFRHKKSSLLDINRHGDQLMEAISALTPLAARMAVEEIDRAHSPLVFIPLHTGDDTFLSPSQFEKFYWAPLRAVMEGIVEAGGVPLPFAEGSYKSRLEYFLELPKGSVCLMLDRTDMQLAKKAIGGHCCLAGNIPAFAFLMDDAQEMARRCQGLIEAAAPGGGFMICSGTALDRANRGMVEAMIETVERFGWY